MPMDTILGNALPQSGDDAVKCKGLPDRGKLVMRMKALKAARRDWEARWKAIRDFELPYIGEFEDTADHTNPARRRDTKIAQGVAWMAANVMAAGIMSGLTPPSRQWFKFSFSDERLNDMTEALQVLDQRQEIVQAVLAKSNFYNAVHKVYLEIPFGQGPMVVLRDARTAVRFIPLTIGSYFIDVDGAGKVNTIARRYKLTLSQLVDAFGMDALPQTVRLAAEMGKSSSRKYTVNWLCEPNTDAVPNKIDRLNMPYKSIYWLDESRQDEYLYIGGFEEFPAPTARWTVNANDCYAKGPGWFAEADSRALQVMKRDFLTLLELMAKPPMQATTDVMMHGINLIPGGITPTNGQGGVGPLFNTQFGNLQYLTEEIQKTEDRIKRHFNSDLFLMFDNIEAGRLTAREVTVRQQERLQVIGPVVEQLQDEFLTPIIERVYRILDEAGKFPPVSEMLQDLINEDVKVEYISPLAQAQKMSGLVNIEQAVGFTLQMAQAWPDALKVVDPTKTIAKYMNLLGAPADMRRSPDEVKKMIEEEQAAMQKQQEEAQAMAAAQAVPGITQAAKNATEAANDGNPALQEWLGM